MLQLGEGYGGREQFGGESFVSCFSFLSFHFLEFRGI